MILLHLTTYLYLCKAAHFTVSQDIGESRKTWLRLCLKKGFLAMHRITQSCLRISKCRRGSTTETLNSIFLSAGKPETFLFIKEQKVVRNFFLIIVGKQVILGLNGKATLRYVSLLIG